MKGAGAIDLPNELCTSSDEHSTRCLSSGFVQMSVLLGPFHDATAFGQTKA